MNSIKLLNLNLPIGIELKLIVEFKEGEEQNIVTNNKTGFWMEFDKETSQEEMQTEFAKYVFNEIKDLFIRGLLEKSFESWNIVIALKKNEEQMKEFEKEFKKEFNIVSSNMKKNIEIIDNLSQAVTIENSTKKWNDDFIKHISYGPDLTSKGLQ